MKPLYLFFAAILCCVVVSCSKSDSSTAPGGSAPGSSTGKSSVKGRLGAMSRNDSDVFSTIIPIDTANRMIASYLYSIPASKSESTLRSITFNADSLRYLLSNPAIKNVKLMLAHTQDYINAGNYGTDAGLKANAVTIIIAGYDANGDYTYTRSGVMDHGIPCPTSCPSVGTAAAYTLQ